jgi:phenylacetate-CoA ligase
MAADPFPTRSTIASSQLEQLRRLLAALVPANSFYTRKFSRAGVTAAVMCLDEFSKKFPFTTKQELADNQCAQPPYGSNLTFPLERYTRFHQTSGTTGAPLHWLDTPESWNWMVENWAEILRAAGATAGDRVFFAFSFGPFIGFWLAYEAAQRIGCLCLPGGGLSSAARLRVLMENGATILCCTPTYALRLAEVAAEEKIDLRAARVRTIIVAGEPGGSIPALRARLQKLWHGVRVFDHHGMTETGPVTHECPKHPGVLHVLEPAYFAEVIDPVSTKPIAPGQRGELVLTTLGRTGSPVLRYRTGDLVKLVHQQSILRSKATVEDRSTIGDQPCECGRHTLALDGGILGRTDDMVIVRGVNVFPSAVEDIIRSCGDVAEYQVTVSNARSLIELSVQIEPALVCPDPAALVKRLEKSFEDAFALRVPVKTVPTGTLPRFEMKAKRWVKIGSQ